MAEFNLKLNINGIETAVASVEDLEAALKATKDEMKTLQIGSEGFNVAAQNAQKLDSALKNVKLATEGVDTKQLAGSFAKLGETVTGAFAIATNAVGLFGKENEDVSKAAVKAQQAIAVVMGARAIAEGVVEGRIAARLILEKVTIANQALMTSLFGAQAVAISAQAVATGEATVAQYALNVAMEANPIGLVVLAITALVGAFALLGDSEEEEIERTERLNKIKKEQADQVEKEVVDIKLRLSAKVDALQREKALLEASGASQEALLEKEKQIADEKLRILSYVKGYRGELNASEIKEQKDLQNDKLVEEAKYNASIAKVNQDVRDKKKKEKEDDAKASKAIDDAIYAEKQRLDVAAAEGELARLEIQTQQKREYTERQEREGKISYQQLTQSLLNIERDYELQKKQIKQEELTKEEAARIDQINKESAFYALLNSNRTRLSKISNAERTDQEKVAEEEKNAAIIASDKSKNDRLIKAGEVFQDDVKKQAEAEKEIVRQAAEEKEQIEKDYQDKIKDLRQKQIEDTINDIAALIRALVEIGNQGVDIANAINDGKKEADQRALNDLRDSNAAQESANNEHYNAELANLDAQLASGQISKQQYAVQQKALEDKLRKDKEALDKAFSEKEKALKKEAFERDKKSKAASIVMNTIMGSVSAFTGMVSAIPGPVGLVLGGISAALVTALGVVQLSNLNKTKFDGGAPSVTPVATPGDIGGGDVGGAGAIGGGGSGGGITSFNPALTGAPTGGTTTGGSGTQPPVRVYVVESDITNAQKSVSVAESNATF